MSLPRKTKGVILGGWIGGLFEFLITGHNACENRHNGDFYCRSKYESLEIHSYCVNIFYNDRTMIDENRRRYMCLCRLRNQTNVKYRHCDFIKAKID